MNNFKNKLLDLLKSDSDIKQAIRDVFSSETDHRNVDQISQLQKELEESKHKIKKILGRNEDETSNLKSQIKQLEESLGNKKKENISLKEIIEKNKDQIKYYKDTFKEDIDAYQLFESLSNSTKKSLSSIFKDDSMSGFIACGIQERNISNLWEYLKNEVIEDKNKDITNLKMIFEFLFSRYVLAHPIYERQQVDLGSTFDSQLHIRHSCSKNVSGDIQKVLLSGWINKKTNKLVKQSVVII